MSTETQPVEEVKEVKTEMFKADGIEIRQHPCGDVAIIGGGLVPAKLIDILMASLDDGGFDIDGHGLFTIVFRDDGFPMSEEGVLNAWAFSIDACSAMCNIQHCVELAFQDTMNPDVTHSEKASIHMAVWKNMLKGFFHETYHSNSAITDPWKIRFDAEFQASDEEIAPEFAREQLMAVAKRIDIEPVFTQNLLDMINERLEAELKRIEESDDATKADKAWAFHQKYLLEKGGMFYAPPEDKDEEGLHLMTFKEYLQFFSDDPDSDEWKTQTVGVVQGESTYTPTNETAAGKPAVDTSVGVYVDPEADPEFDAGDDLPFEPDFEPAGFGGVGTAPAADGFQGVAAQTAPATAPVETPATAPVQPTYQPAPAAGGGYGQPQGGGYGQATTQPAGGGYGAAPASVQVGAQEYPALNIDANTAQNIINNLYLKIFGHIMQTCGFQYGTVQVGQDTSALQPFSQKDNVKAHLVLDANELMFVKEFKAENNGSFVKCDGAIQGFFSDKAQKLPTYELKLQNLDGTTCTRRIFPQNPFKLLDWKNASAGFTQRALEAQSGKQILWILNPDNKQFTYMVEQGQVKKLA